MTILLSDFLQEAFLEPGAETATQILRFLNYRKQRTVFLHVLAGEELQVDMTGTKNLIDKEDKSTLRVTLDTGNIGVYEKALKAYTGSLQEQCAKAGAFYAICNTDRDFYRLIFEDLRMLYDI